MVPVALIAGKAVLAGCLVALISQLSTALKPKMFAGLLAAAPSVAAASLLLTGLDKPASVGPAGQGMVAGAVGMIACCVIAAAAMPRAHALVASAMGWLAWAVAAAGTYLAVWR